jgi:hypothetical protein
LSGTWLRKSHLNLAVWRSVIMVELMLRELLPQVAPCSFNFSMPKFNHNYWSSYGKIKMAFEEPSPRQVPW